MPCMKLDLIRKETIKEFFIRNTQSRASLEECSAKVKNADWKKPASMQGTFRSTDLHRNGLSWLVFNTLTRNLLFYTCFDNPLKTKKPANIEFAGF